MFKFAIFILFILISSLANAQKAIVAYSPQGPYSGPIIVYSYTTADGGIALSHCRAANRANLQYAFSQYTNLNLNSCDLSYRPPSPQAAAPIEQINPPTPLAF